MSGKPTRSDGILNWVERQLDENWMKIGLFNDDRIELPLPYPGESVIGAKPSCMIGALWYCDICLFIFVTRLLRMNIIIYSMDVMIVIYCNKVKVIETVKDLSV